MEVEVKEVETKSPWLSVIIPAFNCSDTIERLLDSIVAQEDPDVEVIICDDWSTDNFMEKVTPYADKLNIKYLKTKQRDVHCPGNTRRDGWKAATGEWITFIDNDDMFEKNAFFYVKMGIATTKETRVMYSLFRSVMPNGEYGQVMDGITWMHGKFYNREWLISTGIDFKENMYTHEDLYFNGLVFGYLTGIGAEYHRLSDKVYTYKWVFKEDSMSREYMKKDHSFVETNFKDYIIASSEPWFKTFYDHPDKMVLMFNQLCSVVLYCYFYYQSFVYSKDEPIKENLDMIKYLVYRICFDFGATRNDIIARIYASPEYYRHIYNRCIGGNCDFVEVVSFRDFILSL